MYKPHLNGASTNRLFCSFTQLRAQYQINLELMELYCVTSSTYTLGVDINTSDLIGDSVEVSINNESLGQFDTIAFPLVFNDFVYDGTTNNEIYILLGI